jgi:hypothetical protein
LPEALEGVYSYDGASGAFKLEHSETGVPYDKTDKETLTANASLSLKAAGCVTPTAHSGLAASPSGACVWPSAPSRRRIKPSFEFAFDGTPIKVGGINFAGKLTVTHSDGIEFVVHVPGKLTYDPAGRTGDPHASERVGNSWCNAEWRFMATWMAALQHGATEADINTLFTAVAGIITELMGRDALYEWTRLQLVQACLRHQTPIDYTSFIRGVRRSPHDVSPPHSRTALNARACVTCDGRARVRSVSWPHARRHDDW